MTRAAAGAINFHEPFVQFLRLYRKMHMFCNSLKIDDTHGHNMAQ